MFSCSRPVITWKVPYVSTVSFAYHHSPSATRRRRRRGRYWMVQIKWHHYTT